MLGCNDIMSLQIFHSVYPTCYVKARITEPATIAPTKTLVAFALGGLTNSGFLGLPLLDWTLSLDIVPIKPILMDA